MCVFSSSPPAMAISMSVYVGLLSLLLCDAVYHAVEGGLIGTCVPNVVREIF